MVSEYKDLLAMRGRLRSLLPRLKDGHARVVNLVITDPQSALNGTAAQIIGRSASATPVRPARAWPWWTCCARRWPSG
ncbi:hypothetical protein [Nesterenkonia populi]